MSALRASRVQLNWTRGLLRLWLVASLLWAVPVGWLTWPGDAPQDYARYWYYRVAHREVLEERAANEAATAEQRDAAWAEIDARYDGRPHALTSDELQEVLDRITSTARPESEQLQKFTTLERDLSWDGEHACWWAACTFVPPIAVLIVGSSLLWALRGFRQTQQLARDGGRP
jgi:hypothetical protein